MVTMVDYSNVKVVGDLEDGDKKCSNAADGDATDKGEDKVGQERREAVCVKVGGGGDGGGGVDDW